MFTWFLGAQAPKTTQIAWLWAIFEASSNKNIDIYIDTMFGRARARVRRMRKEQCKCPKLNTIANTRQTGIAGLQSTTIHLQDFKHTGTNRRLHSVDDRAQGPRVADPQTNADPAPARAPATAPAPAPARPKQTPSQHQHLWLAPTWGAHPQELGGFGATSFAISDLPAALDKWVCLPSQFHVSLFGAQCSTAGVPLDPGNGKRRMCPE